MNETQERSSTTTKTLVSRVVMSLALSLRAIVGLLISFEQRYGNAEFYAHLATEDTPSSSKDTTKTPKSPKPSSTSPKSTVLTYEDPFAFIHDVVNEKVPLDEVSMQQWVYGVLTAMTIKQCPTLDFMVMYKGSYYNFHHHITSIAPPAPAGAILRTQQ